MVFKVRDKLLALRDLKGAFAKLVMGGDADQGPFSHRPFPSEGAKDSFFDTRPSSSRRRGSMPPHGHL